MAKTNRSWDDLTDAEIHTWAKTLTNTGSIVKAYRSIYPTARMESVRRRAPLLAQVPRMQSALNSMQSHTAESVSDADVMRHTKQILSDPDLSARDRLAAITVYDRLRRNLVGPEQAKEFSGSLRAYLAERGVAI